MPSTFDLFKAIGRHCGVFAFAMLGIGSIGCEPATDAASASDAAPSTTMIEARSGSSPRQVIVGTTCEVGELGRCLERCGRGDALSCNNLGAMAELGRGTQRNISRAVSLYESACTQGAVAACLNAKRLRSGDELQHTPNIVEPSPDTPIAGEEPAKPVATPTDEVASATCTGNADCEARCHAGDAESCRQLPGIHIQGNVEIHGNVQMFGNVYLYGPNVHIDGNVLKKNR